MKFMLIGFMAFALIGCQNQTAETTVLPTETTEVSSCAKDLKICPDGQSIGRNIKNQCKFFDCPTPPEVIACPEDVKQCTDGSYVTRDQSKFCEFKPCPDNKSDNIDESGQSNEIIQTVKGCTNDIKTCPDGREVGRNPKNGCQFHACVALTDKKDPAMLCTQEVKQCSDGSFVGRDSNKNCAFKPCPEATKSR